MQSRPLRDFERGAHLHVLDWSHQTARIRLQAAGEAQVRAAAKAIVAGGHPDKPPELPSLEAAICAELRKLYALGHATVRSELDHQASGLALPIGLSAAPEPPNLRRARPADGAHPHCGSCKMYDASAGVCWGYGNHPVSPDEVCDSYAPDPEVRTLALTDTLRDPGMLRARAALIASDVAHQVWQAIARAKLQGITAARVLRRLGREAGQQALRSGASHHAGGAIASGRRAAVVSAGSTIHGPDGPVQVIGARYTSVLDKNTCVPCSQADDGVLRALDDPALVQPPNPACLGGDRCRCLLVYQLRTEKAPAPVTPVPVLAGAAR